MTTFLRNRRKRGRFKLACLLLAACCFLTALVGIGVAVDSVGRLSFGPVPGDDLPPVNIEQESRAAKLFLIGGCCAIPAGGVGFLALAVGLAQRMR